MSDIKCPFCGKELDTENYYVHCHNPHCNTTVEMEGTEEMWEALIQSQQQLKLLELIVASLQGRADINAEVARDSNELVVQWYEKYEQSQKDLEIARKAADNSREKLAAFMHDTWGNWFAYQLNNSTVENLQRWGIQSNTPYSSLTETDKDKDRKFADKIIEIIKEQIEHKE